MGLLFLIFVVIAYTFLALCVALFTTFAALLYFACYIFFAIIGVFKDD